MEPQYFKIPVNTTIFCIDLQEQISISRDIIVELTNTCYGSDYVFVKKKELLFNFPGQIPCLVDRRGEFGLSKSLMIPFTIPAPVFYELVYGAKSE